LITTLTPSRTKEVAQDLPSPREDAQTIADFPANPKSIPSSLSMEGAYQ